MSDYMTLLHKHKINGGFLAPDRIPMEERNKNEMILELQNQLHEKEKIIKEVREYVNHYETIRGYYEYEELGYDEYNYDEDLKQELLEILNKGE